MTQPQYSMPGANVLLLGETGTGKTHCIRTLIPAGVTPFVLFTEPGMRTLGDVKCPELHWKYIPPSAPTFAELAKSATSINTSFDFEALTKRKDWDKTKYRQWLEILTTMNEFVCDRCGESFGGVDTWQTDRAIVIDSMSGLATMSMDLAVGSKPVKAPGDWGVAMDNLERFLTRMTGGTQCHFVLTGHLEREKNEVTGGVQLMISTLGQKLAPKIPRNFDDVIQCIKDEKDWAWSTSAPNINLKGRNVPTEPRMQPSFGQLIESWKSAGGVIIPTSQENAA